MDATTLGLMASAHDIVKAAGVVGVAEARAGVVERVVTLVIALQPATAVTTATSDVMVRATRKGRLVEGENNMDGAFRGPSDEAERLCSEAIVWPIQASSACRMSFAEEGSLAGWTVLSALLATVKRPTLNSTARRSLSFDDAMSVGPAESSQAEHG
ncbi:MAG: hypothetical protein JWP75_2974 [Frondihabitans sp.]|nr:hypothetical protein [Frondihabitans sp.]